MYEFCTYFDQHYLLRGITLYRSLQQHCATFRLHVLCMDQQTYNVIKSLHSDNLIPIQLQQLEQWQPQLLHAKGNREKVEYFFTLTPHLPQYLLQQNPKLDTITYLDADMLFFSSPAPLFAEMGDGPLLYFEHRFPPHLRKNEKYGRFNVEYLTFRNNAEGNACLERWASQCLEWCRDKLEDHRYADQKYLDEWPSRYPNGVIAEHPGAGVAPWNWGSGEFKLKDNCMQVDGETLIFYHYHALKILSPHWVSLGMARYGRMPRFMARFFYYRYLSELKDSQQWLAKRDIAVQLTDSAVQRVGHFLLRTIISASLRGQLMKIP